MEKFIKIRIHHLSYYHVYLKREETPKSLKVVLYVKNYVDGPPSHSSLREMYVSTFMDSSQTEHVFDGLGINTSRIKSCSNFIETFGRLEYYVDGLLHINSEIKKVKKGQQDKELKRRQIKEWKRNRLAVQRPLVQKCTALLDI